MVSTRVWRTDWRTDGPTDERTYPLTEMRERISKATRSFLRSIDTDCAWIVLTSMKQKAVGKNHGFLCRRNKPLSWPCEIDNTIRKIMNFLKSWCHLSQQGQEANDASSILHFSSLFFFFIIIDFSFFSNKWNGSMDRQADGQTNRPTYWDVNCIWKSLILVFIVDRLYICNLLFIHFRK